MKEQEIYEYPNFKKQIINELVEKYSFREQTAKRILLISDIKQSIDDDIEWAQHMGPEYWAKEINDYFSR